MAEFFGYPEAQIVRTEEQLPQKFSARRNLRQKTSQPSLSRRCRLTPRRTFHLFRNAQICISRRGWIEDFQAPYYHLHVPRHLRIPPEVNEYLQNEGWEKLRLLAEEDEISTGHSRFLGGCSSPFFSCGLYRNSKRHGASHGLLLQIRKHRAGSLSGRNGEHDGSRRYLGPYPKRRRYFASIYDPEVFVRHPMACWHERDPVRRPRFRSHGRSLGNRFRNCTPFAEEGATVAMLDINAELPAGKRRTNTNCRRSLRFLPC